MTTPRDVIMLALRDVGAVGEGETPIDSEVNDAFTRLNWMLSQWQRKRWLVYHLVDLSTPLATGAQYYTIGPSGDINVAVRPDKIESAFVRQAVPSQPNLIDYPLQLIFSWEDYSRIALKTLVSFPSYLFYDNAYPVGKIYPWPVPQANEYYVHVQVKELLNQFTSIDQVVALPEEYLPAFEWNLALRLAPSYGMANNPDIKSFAKDSLNVLRTENSQIAALVMPSEVIRPGIYNPYSDQIR